MRVKPKRNVTVMGVRSEEFDGTMTITVDEFDCDRCGQDCGDEVYSVDDEFCCGLCVTDEEWDEQERRAS